MQFIAAHISVSFVTYSVFVHLSPAELKPIQRTSHANAPAFIGRLHAMELKGLVYGEASGVSVSVESLLKHTEAVLCLSNCLSATIILTYIVVKRCHNM